MSEKKLPNRIPANASKEWSPWLQPYISDNGQVVSSVGKDAHDKNKAKRQTDAESIENVRVNKLPSLRGMNAGQLQEIVENAERDGFNEGEKKGFEKGQIEGYAAGRVKGLADTKQELLAVQKTFASLTQSLLEPLADADERLEALLLNMVTRLTRAVVRRELLIESGDIVQVIKNALRTLPQEFSSISIKLHPDDLAVVESYAEEQQQSWKFVVDDSLSPGGLCISTPESRVDDTVEHRLDEILASFLERQNVDEEFLKNDTCDSESETLEPIPPALSEEAEKKENEPNGDE